MDDTGFAFRVGGFLYDHAFPAYRVAYSAYKVVTDRHERRLIRNCLKPGATAIDIGANIGSYTRFLARIVGATGRVLAFEPDRRNYTRLDEAVAKLPNVTTVQAAIGEVTGDVRLYESADLNVDHRTYDPGGHRRNSLVKAYRLDDYVARGSAVDFIKMDIQGAEYGALEGMRRVLSDNADIVILAEYWPAGLRRAGASADRLLGYLGDLGFDVEFIVNGSLTTETPQLGDSMTDYTSLLARRQVHCHIGG